MRHIRQFDTDSIKMGGVGPWIISPDEGAECTIRVRRGGGVAKTEVSEMERFAIMLKGQARGSAQDDTDVANPGDVIFFPCNVSGAVVGDEAAVWLEVTAQSVNNTDTGLHATAIRVEVDESKFEGDRFKYQGIIDRSRGADSMRMNACVVSPAAGSPDFHIHAFAQIYVVQEGEMTIDIGRARYNAGPNTLVYLPAGVVHRNFNASDTVERHISLLIPEPAPGEIFDFAMTMHEHEADFMTVLPGAWGNGALAERENDCA
jgi:mannose-6-phosphate isomerase-like protein (cupin superfamily)